jgi:hypothetical protein
MEVCSWLLHFFAVVFTSKEVGASRRYGCVWPYHCSPKVLEVLCCLQSCGKGRYRRAVWGTSQHTDARQTFCILLEKFLFLLSRSRRWYGHVRSYQWSPMHVKCIHDLCSLLVHILSYLIVLWGPGLVCHWFRGFLNNPLLFDFNTVKQIFLFLHVFDFHGPSGHQTDPNFFHFILLGNTRTG